MMFGVLKHVFRERKLAKSAEKKLKLAEEKISARAYIKKAKRAGVHLSEEEALAYVRSERRKQKILSLFGGFAPPKMRKKRTKRNTGTKRRKKARNRTKR